MRTHRAFSAVLLAVAGFAQIAAGQAPDAPPVPDAPAWGLAHPNAKVLISLDLKSLRESAVGKLLSAQLNKQLSQQQPSPLAVAVPLIMQTLNDVDRVLISSPSTGPGPAGRSGVPSANTPFLMVFEGRFGPGSPLGFFMTGSPEVYHQVNIYTPPAVGNMTVSRHINLALLNEKTLLIGDSQSLHGAIDRQGLANAGISAALRARAEAISKGHDFWVVLQDSLAALPSNPALAGAASEIQGVEIGLGMHDGAQLDVTMTTKSDVSARLMSQFLLAQLQGGLASSQMAGAAEISKNLRVSAQGNQMRLSLRLTPEELEHEMRALQTQRALAQNMPQSSQPKFTQAKSAPAQFIPAKPAKIKIYGLDEGTREIDVRH